MKKNRKQQTMQLNMMLGEQKMKEKKASKQSKTFVKVKQQRKENKHRNFWFYEDEEF